MMSELTFEPWPKIPRLNRDIVITEKIDGTNAAVIVTEDGQVGAQSRTRLITPDADNFGFAKWVSDNSAELASTLGPGRHFGEWWGSGIQRGYGLAKGERRFSLFNVNRYASADFSSLPGVALVPTLYVGPFTTDVVAGTVAELAANGSVASRGFMRPEGVVVFHTAAQSVFKVMVEGDEIPKELAA